MKNKQGLITIIKLAQITFSFWVMKICATTLVKPLATCLPNQQKK